MTAGWGGRTAVAVAAALLGLAGGALAVGALQREPDAARPEPPVAPVLVDQPAGEPTTARATTTAAAAGATAPTAAVAPATGATTGPSTTVAPEPAPDRLLVWTSGNLPAGLGEAVAGQAGVVAVTTVRGDRVDLVASFDPTGQPVDAEADGWAIPLDAIAIDPTTYPAFVDDPVARAALAALGPGQAVLGETSAALRRLDPGGRLRFTDGQEVVVTAVVPDLAVAAAEVVLAVPTDPATGGAAGTPTAGGVTTDRYLLVDHRADRAVLEADISFELTPGRPVRFRAPGETRWMHHGDAVLPQALIKQRFGEFAYRPPPVVGDRTNIEIDPRWAADNIRSADLPLLGRVQCHKDVIEPLRAALQDLADRGLGFTVSGSLGCFVPGIIPSSGGVSRHSWGVAFDVNPEPNPRGLSGSQNDALVQALADVGFTNGEPWLIPDPVHFEWIGG